MYKLTILLIAGSLSLITTYAYAYIGPGMGGGMIAATVGIVLAIFAALLGVLYYPIKRFLKNKKQKNITDENTINEHKTDEKK